MFCHPERSEAESKDPGSVVIKSRHSLRFLRFQHFQQPRSAFFLAVRMDFVMDLRMVLRLDLDLDLRLDLDLGSCWSVLELCLCLCLYLACKPMHLHSPASFLPVDSVFLQY